MENSCPNFIPHPFRNKCKRCRRSKECHKFNKAAFGAVRFVLELEQRPSGHPEYAWVPKNCPAERIGEYFRNFPEQKVPTHDSEGQRYREKQFTIQLLLQDVYPEICRFVKKGEDFLEHKKFIKERNTKAVDEGQITVWQDEMPRECTKCHEETTEGKLAVTSPKAGKEYAWHPACFVCHDCGKQPVDLIHCVGSNGKVYCLRHYGESNRSRCHSCDELIYSKQVLTVDGKTWHPEHFCCMSCDIQLVGKRFATKNSQPYCYSCYERQTRHSCQKCREFISVDQLEIAFGGKRWHKQCFVCAGCGQSIAEKEYVNREERHYCVQCYSDRFCLQCLKCHKPILPHEASPENDRYHAECIYCQGCSRPLINRKVHSKEGMFYCERCYVKSFCKICNDCGDLIEPNTSCVEYENFAWHNECFNCVGCSKSLVNEHSTQIKEGFVCEECRRRM